MRYKLRTLLILLAILPPLLWVGWTKYEAWRAAQEKQRAARDFVVEFQWGLRTSVPIQELLVLPTDEPPVTVPEGPQPKAPAKAGDPRGE